jgi:hypothetical protein
MQYTVTKMNQKRSSVLENCSFGNGKVPCGCMNILSLAYAGILHSSMPEDMLNLNKKIVNGCSEQSESFKCFSKNLKQKFLGGCCQKFKNCVSG